MIVLDTNVESEMMRQHPLRALPSSQICTTIMCKAEILFGIALLPHDRGKQHLGRVAQTILADAFGDRMLGFDDREYALICAARQRAGSRMQIIDGLVAGIVRANRFASATRDVAGLADCGTEIIDSWNT